MTGPLALRGIHVYPIKGCAGVSLEESAIDAAGLAHDRRWMVVNSAGRFISQREQPTLATVSPSFHGDVLELSAVGMTRLRRPLRPTSGTSRRVSVWSDTCDALEDREASAWFSDYLRIECFAVFVGAPARSSPQGGSIAFPDEYPILLASESSLADLNARLLEPVRIARFRPNFVVAGQAPFAEDHWTELRMGDVAFSVAERCARCKVIEVDPESGAQSPGPLRALAAYRKGERGVYFGIYLTVTAPGTVRVGEGASVVAGSSTALASFAPS